MTTPSQQLDRTERIARAVGRLRRNMLSHVSRAMEGEGAPLVHWQLISAIAYEGPYSQSALATRVGMDPAGTSRALDELERAGLVKRERDDDDRRRVSLALTAKGRRWYARVRDLVFGELAPMFEPLSSSEARQLETLLSRLTAHSSGSSRDGSE